MRGSLDLYRNQNRVSPFKFFNSIFPEDFSDLFFDKELKNNYPLACDTIETEKSYIYKMDIPGVNKEDISLSINHDVLEVTAQRSQEEEVKDKKGVRRTERYYGSFYRAIPLPQDTKQEVDATYKNGVLTLIVAKEEESKKNKKIEIKG